MGDRREYSEPRTTCVSVMSRNSVPDSNHTLRCVTLRDIVGLSGVFTMGPSDRLMQIGMVVGGKGFFDMRESPVAYISISISIYLIDVT